MKKLLITLIFIFLCINVFAGNTLQSLTNGIYANKENYYSWNIKDNHTIVWNGDVYIPCGYRVIFKSLMDPSCEKLLEEDKRTIEDIAFSGIKDVLISNNSQIIISNPNVLNEIIALLNEYEINYGIDLSVESTMPLKGYLINPCKYRIDGPYPENTIIKMWEEVDSGIYVKVNKITGEISEKGSIAKSNNGQIIIKLKKKITSNEALLVYPHTTYFNNFDLWNGYNEIRDILLKYFNNIDLGERFKFFYNPFNLDKLCKIVDQDDFVPNSSGFNIPFENYLTENYFHGASLANSWAITKSEANLDQIADYLKLFPMWNKGRGCEFMYSLVTGDYLDVDTINSTYWIDLNILKLKSIQDYMNSISTVLRDNIANVPIIFSSSMATKTFTIPYQLGSCDGFAYTYDKLGIEEINDLGILYAYASNNPKTSVLFSINNDNNLIDDYLELSTNCGYKGFFFNYNLKNANKIKQIKNSIKDTKLEGLAFPAELPLNAQKLDDNTFWYPSNDQYIVKKYGEDIYAYQKYVPDTYRKNTITEAVFFSLKSKRKITIVGNDSNDCKILYPKGKRIKKGYKVLSSHEYTFEIDNTPTLVSNVNLVEVCPKEAVEELMKKYDKFIKESKFEKNTIELMKKNYKDIKEVYNNHSYLNAYGMISEKTKTFMSLVGSDVWMEVESFTHTSFNKKAVIEEASQNAILLLDTDEVPKLGTYYVSHNILAPFTRSYVVWILATKPEISSPFQFSYDNNPYIPVSTKDIVPYTDNLCWYKAGIVNLNSGNHTINIAISGPNTGSFKYFLGLDAIFMTSSENKPNGIEKPEIILNIR